MKNKTTKPITTAFAIAVSIALSLTISQIAFAQVPGLGSNPFGEPDAGPPTLQVSTSGSTTPASTPATTPTTTPTTTQTTPKATQIAKTTAPAKGTSKMTESGPEMALLIIPSLLGGYLYRKNK